MHVIKMELIREQFADIQPPQVDIKRNVLLQIQIRKRNRRRRMQILAAASLLVVILLAVQFPRIAVVAENLYRNIQLSLNNGSLVIHNDMKAAPIKVDDLTWVGSKPNRVGMKQYGDIHAAETELKIRVLHNTMSYEPVLKRQIPFSYFEKQKMGELLLNDLFIGDLRNFKESILENGDRQATYSADHTTIYKSPVSMKVMFFTGGGANYEANNLDVYNYEEKYISPVNGITAYFLRDTSQIASNEERLLTYAAGDRTDAVTVFVHDQLFYTISGNIPSDEMKQIIDSFVIRE